SGHPGSRPWWRSPGEERHHPVHRQRRHAFIPRGAGLKPAPELDMPEATKPEKPIPVPDASSAPFWEATLEGKLLLMECGDCGHVRLPSREHCDRCLSTNTRWIEASGRGV